MKAAFLFKITKFLTWPDSAHPGNSSVVVGVMTPDPFGGYLDEAFAGKTIDGRSVVLRRLSPGKPLTDVDLLFVPRESESRIEDIASLQRRRMLVVGESPGFAQKKGHIGLTISGGKLAFEINASQLKACGFTADSRLLQLARRVY